MSRKSKSIARKGVIGDLKIRKTVDMNITSDELWDLDFSRDAKGCYLYVVHPG